MSDDDSSVGHPEQQPDGTAGNAIDAYFNLNPDKFHAMPTGEFLQLAKGYQEVSASYDRAKQALLDLDDKKKQLEDEARANDTVEQPVEQPSDASAEVPADQPALEQAIKSQEEQAEELAEQTPTEQPPTPTEEHQEEPPVETPVDEHYEAPGDHIDATPEQQPPQPPVEEQPDDGRPHISHAETDIGAGPAL